MNINEIIKDMENTLKNHREPCHVLDYEDIQVVLRALKEKKPNNWFKRIILRITA